MGVLFCAVAMLHAQSDDPTLIDINNLEKLNAIRYDLDGNGMPDADASEADSIVYEDAFGLDRRGSVSCTGGACAGYELMRDLDFEDGGSYAAGSRNDDWVNPANGGTTDTEGWEPIRYESTNSSYRSVFEGNNHTISNLYINRFSSSNFIHYVGLFGGLYFGAEVRHLGVERGSVTSEAAGGLVVGVNRGTIRACYSTGAVTSEAAGGLVGVNRGTIRACYSTGAVTGEAAGGLVGVNQGTIHACYSTGAVTGEIAGGLVGGNFDAFDELMASPTIVASYSTGAVTGEVAGGLVGSNATTSTIRACYSTGAVTGEIAGGLVGPPLEEEADLSEECMNDNINCPTPGVTEYSYFDYETAGFSASDDYAQSSAALRMPTGYDASIYANWNMDMDDLWDFGTTGQYPALKVDFDGITGASVDEFGQQRMTRFLSASYAFLVVPNASAGAEAGTVYANPADFNHALMYNISSQTLDGNEVSTFNTVDTEQRGINAGVIRVADLADFVEDNVYMLVVEANDGNGSIATANVAITIKNGPPTFDRNFYSFEQDEHTAANTVLGTVPAKDPNVGEVIMYSFVSPDSRFAIDESTGAISNTVVIDYETTLTEDERDFDGVIYLDVQASDGVNDPAITTVAITINDVDEGLPVNEAPTFDEASYSFAQDENAAANTALGTVTATDPENDALTYSLTNTGGDKFAIDESTGAISNTVVIDYEALSDTEKADGFTVTVQASDGTNNATTDVTITINDVNEGTPVNEAPTFDEASYSFAQDENAAANTALGTVTATDPENDALTYSLTNTGGDKFEIDESTGAISNAVVIDYEALSDTEKADGITVTVQASDGTNNATTDVTITINDVDETDPPLSVPAADVTLSVYPNPASEVVRFVGLSAARTYLYKVCSLVGHQVAKGSLRGGSAIELAGLSSGQYILVLEGKEGSEAFRTQLRVLKR